MKNMEKIPSNNIERKMSEAQWAELLTKIEKYRERIIRESQDASQSYKHIMGNFSGMSCFFMNNYSDGYCEKTDEAYSKALEVANYMERYFKLLDDFPEFAKKELEKGEGYFSKLYKSLTDSKQFVDEYEAELKKIYG